MNEVIFDLGKNIVLTAKASGMSEFSVDSIDNSIEYSVASLPNDLPFKFARPGYEVTVKPLFAFSLEADRNRTPDDIVFRATLQLESRFLKSHEAAQAYVGDLLAQFNNGKWARNIRSTCPAVSGRSSYLDTSGNVNAGGCPLDPTYLMTLAEWKKLFSTRRKYEWIGGGVVAKLTFGFSELDSQPPSYTIFLEFADHKTQEAMNAEFQLRDNKAGDEKGWNTTAEWELSKKTTAEEIKILEANALKRGDKVIPR